MNRPTVPDVTADVGATVAFVQGHYAEHCLSLGEAVPEWAWLNLLAHGTTHELRHHSQVGRTGDLWHQARAFMADEIVDHVERRQVPLERFQKDVLVPLELDSIACQTTSHWTPGGFAIGLLVLLSGRPRTPRDPCRCPRCTTALADAPSPTSAPSSPAHTR
jgi:hypothetical protein